MGEIYDGQEQQGDNDGKGLIRDITIGKMKVRERVEEVDPGKSLSYSLIEGTPTKSYKGNAGIEEVSGETRLTWSGDFVPKIPLTGYIVMLVARRAVTKDVDAVLANLEA